MQKHKIKAKFVWKAFFKHKKLVFLQIILSNILPNKNNI